MVEGAIPFPTRYGQRVLVTASSADLISRFLAGFLAGLPNPGKTNSVIIDDKGIVVASPDKGVKPGERYKDAKLLRALDDAPYGPYKLGGVDRHYSSTPVVTSPWKVVIARDDSVLYSTPSTAAARRCRGSSSASSPSPRWPGSSSCAGSR